MPRRRAHGRRLGAELERLAIHGLCHLFGHDHKKKSEATVMFALERRLQALRAFKMYDADRKVRWCRAIRCGLLCWSAPPAR